MPFKMIGLGEILWDILPQGKTLGGAPANFAYHAQALGKAHVESCIVSRIGHDELGREILATVADLNLDQSYLMTDSAHPTGTVTVAIDNTGSPSYTIERNVAWDYLANIPRKLARSTDVVCFGTLAQRSFVSKNTILEFVAAVPESALKIFDINLRQSFYSLELIKQSLELANVLKINAEELVVVGQLLDIDAGVDAILQEIVNRYALQLGILTKGARGSTLISGEHTSICRGVSVSIQDSVGAGDAFTAAIAIGMLQGHNLEQLNANANTVAAFVCTQAGATPVIPDEISNLF